MHASVPIIDQELVDSVWRRSSEEECRLFSKTALSFLARAPDSLLRLRYLHARGLIGSELRKVSKSLRKEAEKVGALRIVAIAIELEGGKFPPSQLPELLRQLDAEFAATEKRLAEISKALGQAIVEKTRTRRKSERVAR